MWIERPSCGVRGQLLVAFEHSLTNVQNELIMNFDVDSLGYLWMKRMVCCRPGCINRKNRFSYKPSQSCAQVVRTLWLRAQVPNLPAQENLRRPPLTCSKWSFLVPGWFWCFLDPTSHSCFHQWWSVFDTLRVGCFLLWILLGLSVIRLFFLNSCL